MFRLALSLLCLSMAVSACSSRKQPAPKASAPIAAKPAPPKFQPPAPPIPAKQWQVTVLAGSRDHESQPVMVRLPHLSADKPVQVRDANGATVVAQRTSPGVLAFRAKPLKAGEQARYLIDYDEKPAKPDKSGNQGTQNADGIKLMLKNRPVLGYVSRPPTDRKGVPLAASRGGYLHPLYSPAGVQVTDDFPTDKPFQHGVWTTWQKLESAGSHPDFWDLTQGKGRVAVESIGTVWGGPLAVGFDARQYFTDLDKRKGLTVLREAWEVSAFSGTDRFTIVDLSSTQEAISGPTTLETNPFGGILVRGSRDWQGGKALFMTSEGSDRGKAVGAKARWCYLGGKSGGKQAGIAILSHPNNPQAPEAVFVDPTDPVMGFAPTAKGPLSLAARGSLKLKYRYVVFDGVPDSKLLDKLWNEFANPPETQVRVSKIE